PSRPVFFFFQAEDGIRGFHVTGVQTCALPIYTGNLHRVYARCNEFHAEVRELSSVVTYRNRSATLRASGSFLDLTALFERHGFRSEERRVGKEGSVRSPPSHEQDNAMDT